MMVTSDEETRRRIIDAAAELFAEQKEQIGREFGNMKAEIRAVMEEGKTEAQPAAEEEGSDSSEV